MTPEEQKRMLDIDAKWQSGQEVTQEEREFFNSHFEKMQEIIFDTYMHWQFHEGHI